MKVSTQDMDALELVRKHPESIYTFLPEYRQRLCKIHLLQLSTVGLSKTEEAALYYNTAKNFGVKQVQKMIAEILDINFSTFTKRLHMAREAGLIAKKS